MPAQALAKSDPAPIATIDPATLLSKAIEHQMPVESMERLLEMREKLRAEQAAGAFAQALAEFQRSIPPIEKKKIAKITSQKGSFSYRYADLADIQRAIAEQLAQNGLSITFDTKEQGQGIDVICTVHHVAGHHSSAHFPVPIDRSARMSAAQAVGAALTYGRRYALTAALGITTADEDIDAQGTPTHSASQAPASAPAAAATPPAPQPSDGSSDSQKTDKGGYAITAPQKRRLEARIGDLGLQAHRDRIKAWTEKRWGVTSLADLTRAQYDALYTKLDDFAERIAIEQESQKPAEQSAPAASGQRHPRPRPGSRRLRRRRAGAHGTRRRLAQHSARDGGYLALKRDHRR